MRPYKRLHPVRTQPVPRAARTLIMPYIRAYRNNRNHWSIGCRLSCSRKNKRSEDSGQLVIAQGLLVAARNAMVLWRKTGIGVDGYQGVAGKLEIVKRKGSGTYTAGLNNADFLGLLVCLDFGVELGKSGNDDLHYQHSRQFRLAFTRASSCSLSNVLKARSSLRRIVDTGICVLRVTAFYPVTSQPNSFAQAMSIQNGYRII